jgi:hypothetical protein
MNFRFLKKLFPPSMMIRDESPNDLLSTDDEDDDSFHYKRNSHNDHQRNNNLNIPRQPTKTEKQLKIANMKEQIREILEFHRNSSSSNRETITTVESESDFVALNIGGVHYDIERKALLKTPFFYESNNNSFHTLFSAFFSKRWEFYHIKDKNHRIYLDFADEWFNPILSYILNSSSSPSSKSKSKALMIKKENIGCLELLKFFELDSFFLFSSVKSKNSSFSFQGLSPSLFGKDYQRIELLKTFYHKYHNLKKKMNGTSSDIDTVIFSSVLSLIPSRVSSISYSTRVLSNLSFSFHSLIPSFLNAASESYDFCLIVKVYSGYYCLLFDSQLFLNHTSDKNKEEKEEGDNAFDFSDFPPPPPPSSFSSSSSSSVSFPCLFFPLQDYNFFPNNLKGNVYLDINYFQLLAIQQHLSSFSESSTSSVAPVSAEKELLSCFFPLRLLRRPPIEEQTTSSFVLSPFSSSSASSAYPSSLSSPFVNVPPSSSCSYFPSHHPHESLFSSCYDEVDSDNFLFEILSSGQLHYLNSLQEVKSLYVQHLELFTMKGIAHKNMVLQQKAVLPDPFLPFTEFPSNNSQSARSSNSSFCPPPPSPPGLSSTSTTIHPLSSSSSSSSENQPFVTTTIPFQLMEFQQQHKNQRHQHHHRFSSNRSKKMEYLMEMQRERDRLSGLQQLTNPFDETIVKEKDEYDYELLIVKQYYSSLLHEILFMIKYFMGIWDVDEEEMKVIDEDCGSSYRKVSNDFVFSDLKRKLLHLQSKIKTIRQQSIPVITETSEPAVLSSVVKEMMMSTGEGDQVEENYIKLTEIINEYFIDFHHEIGVATVNPQIEEKEIVGYEDQQDLIKEVTVDPVLSTHNTDSSTLFLPPPLVYLISNDTNQSSFSFIIPVLRSTLLHFIPHSQLGIELNQSILNLSLLSLQNDSLTLPLNLLLLSFPTMNNLLLKEVFFLFIDYLRLKQLISFNLSFHYDDGDEEERKKYNSSVIMCSAMNKRMNIHKTYAASSNPKTQFRAFPIIVPSQEHYQAFFHLMNFLGIDCSSIRVIISS